MADLVLPAVLPTELSAVNVLLSCLGESPVSALSPSPSPDVDKALGALQEAMVDVQSRGWKWNQEKAYPLQASSSGLIAVPANTLDLALAYYIPQTMANAQPVSGVVRGLQLYDSYNHTFTFTANSTVYVDVTWLLEWSQLPAQATRVITLEAAQKFISREGLSGVTAQVNEADLRRAWALLEQKEDREGQANQLYGNTDIARKIMGNGSLRRGRING